MTAAFSVQGFGIFSEWNGDLAYTGTTGAIQAIAATGANSVELTPVVFTATQTSNTVFADPDKTDSDASIAQAIETAHAAGLSVVLKPTIEGLDGTSYNALEPSDPAAFFASYQAEIVHLATIAQQEGVETLAIGNEMSQLTGATYLPYWTSLIAAVRQVYKGDLTYAAATDEASKVSFWSQLDTIGVNMYPPLSSAADPSVATLVNAWNAVPTDTYWAQALDNESPVDFLQSLSTQYGKQVLITETGYRSISGTTVDPGDWQTTGTVDDQAQANAYAAFAQVFTSEAGSWLKGVEFWQWDANNLFSATGYSPMGKPAETVVEQLFSGQITPQNLTVSGSALADTISLGNGDNTITGGLGDDTLIGGSGNDVLRGGPDSLAPLTKTTVTVTGYGTGGADMQLWVNGSKVGSDVTYTSATDPSGYQTYSFTFDNPAAVNSLDLALVNAGPGVALYVKSVTVNGVSLSPAQATNNSSPGTFDLYVFTIHFDTSADQDLFFGAASDNDTIDGGAGDDTLIGGAGNDTIDGGPGTDTAVYSGDLSDYRISTVSGVTTVTDSVAGRDGVDSLTNVEQLQFADQTVDLQALQQASSTTTQASSASHALHAETPTVAWQNKATSQVFSWGMQGSLHGADTAIGDPSAAEWHVIGSGDINGDGSDDLIWQDNDTSAIYAWGMTNAQHSSDIALGTVSAAQWTLLGTGDFNGDGTDDLIWQNNANSQVWEWGMAGGHQATNIALGAPALSDWTSLGTADVNGDGTTDVLWQNKASGSVYAWGMQSGQHVSDLYLGSPSPTDWSMIGTGDFNGDGTTDLLWENKSSGALYEWQMQNGQHVADIALGSLSSDWSLIGTGDYNGSGTTDILWQNKTSGAVYEWGMQNGQHASDTFLGTVSGTDWTPLMAKAATSA